MNLKEALQCGDEGEVIGWDEENEKWVLYRVQTEAPEGVKPEFLIIKKGNLPLPLTNNAVILLYDLVIEEGNNG